jgi:hypothetical protein
MERGPPARDDRGMRRRVLALLLACAALAGCGSQERADRPAADRAAVVARVRAYLDAYLAGRGEEACAQYTAALRAQDDRRARAAGVAGGCPAVLGQVGRRLLSQLPPAQRAELLRRLPRTRVDVLLHGDRALATLTLGGERAPSGRRMELQRIGSDWRISRLSIPVGAHWP